MTDTQALTFSEEAFAGYYLKGIVYLILPIAAFLLMRKYRAARIFPVITGIIVYLLSVWISDLCAHFVGFTASFAQKTVIAAEMVCYFEEIGRWLAIKYPLTDIRNTRAAFCYGIGHGGIECLIRGVQQFQIIGYGQRLSSEGLSSFLAGKESEKAAAVTNQLQAYADYSLGLGILDSLHSAGTFAVQIALSVFLFRKMTESNYAKRWLLCAILLHMLLNGLPWAVSLTGSSLAVSLTGMVCNISVIAYIYRAIDGTSCIDEIRYPDTEEA